VDQGSATSYADLRSQVSERAEQLALPRRSVVVLQAANTLGFIVSYLATLHAGHVALLADEHHVALSDVWDAAITIGADGTIHHRSSDHPELHPDLALLMSTSGSTGSPKLVRLSHDNVVSNARAIGRSLGLSADDRGITTLPLHYCYGLSVLHSHLATGAGVVVTEASVLDPCFARAMRVGGVTNVAGVPHTYELLERADPETVHVDSLRFLTQAGGRLRADRLKTWRERARSWGVDFFVMYGQTEATARMAYLPPELAVRHPDAVGRPIPGGHLELVGVDGVEDGVGELVYRGPNVMLGYATERADLALGRTVDALHTGDLARHDPIDGVFELVGRRSRFVKPFGLRIDLDAVEGILASGGIEAVVTGDDEQLVVAAPAARSDDVVSLLTRRIGVPPNVITVDQDEIPRTANGKVDHAALLRRQRHGARPSSSAQAEEHVAEIYRSALGRRDVRPESSFVSLGGDSLSYVECSVRLERRLGRLPVDWPQRTVAELDATPRRQGLPRIDTSALLRTVGILLVVSTHMSLWYFPGGAHLMLAVVGYNMSRFHLEIADRRRRLSATARSLARIAFPVIALTAVCMLSVGGYGVPTLALVNNYLGPLTHEQGRWHFWFVEAIVLCVVVVAALLAVGPVRRIERRFPYAFPLTLLVAALELREHWVAIGGYNNLRFQPHGIVWIFLLGWLVHRSHDMTRKLATTGLALLTLPPFFHRAERGWFIAAGLVLLLWCREVPLPRAAIRPIAAIAGASMAIFITHFRVFPVLTRNLPIGAAYVATIGIGIGIWWGGNALLRHVRPAPSANLALPRLLRRPPREVRGQQRSWSQPSIG